MATMKEIAKLANVSMATVSRVLNKDNSIVVSEPVRDKIFTIAHELGYVPVRQRHLSVEVGVTIGVADWHIIRNDRRNEKLSDLAKIAKQYSKTPVHFVRLIYGENLAVDGIIALGQFNLEEIEYLKKQSCAILFIGGNRKDYQYDKIIIDHTIGIIEMLEYYLDKKKVNSIGYIGGIYSNDEITIGNKRIESFKKLLIEKNKFNQEFFLIGEMSYEGAYQITKNAIENCKIADAVLVGNVEMAQGVIQALEEANLAKKIDIMIYQDIEASTGTNYEVATVQIYTDFMWKYAIQILLERVFYKRIEVLTLTFPSKFNPI